MRYDREYRPRGSRSLGRGEYGDAYEGPFPRGWSEGFEGGSLRSRGSWNAGARGYEPRHPDGSGEFEWGDGYVGGRGYGGTNYDLEHGYATGGRGFRARPPRGVPLREGDTPFSSAATRGGYAWGEADYAEEYGPARYGYGPYYDRLRRRRRADDELRQEVEDTLFYDTWVDADAITVRVQDGVVTLTGVLPSFEELRYAVDDAWDVDGVHGVRSELQVTAPTGTRGRDERASGEVADPERYAAGAPHMHGHPDAGTGGDEYGSGRREDPRGTQRGGRAQHSGSSAGSSAGSRASGSGGGPGTTGAEATNGSGRRTPSSAERATSGSRGSGRTGAGSSGRARGGRGRTAKAEQGGAQTGPGATAGAGDGSPAVDEG